MIIFLIATVFFLLEGDRNFLVIRGNKSGEICAVIPIGNEFSTIYIHSSEKQPWENIYIPRDDGTFILTTMKVCSLGPGVPSNIEEGWKFKIENGYFIYYNINQQFKDICYKVSAISPHYVQTNGRKYNLVDICGDNADINISIGKGFRLDLRRSLIWIRGIFRK